MDRLKIAIDPRLKAEFQREIFWTWRLLLSGMGFSWEEVPINSPECDIAYVIDDNYPVNCRFCVRANPGYWQRRSDYKIKAIEESRGWQYPVFEGEEPAQLSFVKGKSWICQHDIIFYIFWLVTGQEERHWVKNKHGHFDLSGTNFYRAGAPGLALASDIGLKLEGLFVNLGFPAPIQRWPNKKQAAACVSHDVDYPEVIRWLEPLRIISRQGIKGLSPALSVFAGKRNHWHFKSWIALEKKMQTRSAFYFTSRKGSLLRYALGTPDPFYNINSVA